MNSQQPRKNTGNGCFAFGMILLFIAVLFAVIIAFVIIDLIGQAMGFELSKGDSSYFFFSALIFLCIYFPVKAVGHCKRKRKEKLNALKASFNHVPVNGSYPQNQTYTQPPAPSGTVQPKNLYHPPQPSTNQAPPIPSAAPYSPPSNTVQYTPPSVSNNSRTVPSDIPDQLPIAGPLNPKK